MIQSCSFHGEHQNQLYGFSGGINRIMLKFRPIAPKPAILGSNSGMKTANDSPFFSKRRTKRKYVRTNKTNSSKKNNAKCSKNSPEKPMPEDEEKKTDLGLGLGLGPAASESWVVVKGVTAAGGVGLLGFSDGEKMRGLEVDTCPGFVTDGLQRVQWVNPSYKAMVASGGEEVAVRLVVEDGGTIPASCLVFACTARVMYTWRKEKYSKTMPCDVWRMDSGGFAWRLDAKAALSLGR